MTTLKLLSAGLIATAMLTTAASARENSMHAAERAHHASVFPFVQEAPGWNLAPSAGASTEPSEQPDGICDHGDDPEIC